MLAIYFSGTGNTKHCLEKLAKGLDANAICMPLEDPAVAAELAKHDLILFGYSIQFSNAPIMVRDFIKEHSALWKQKRVLCVATMGLFSGDGAGCTARILKKYGATILGGLHLIMPDSVCDNKLLKKDTDEDMMIIRNADQKINKTILNIQKGKYPQEGLGFFYHMAGLFGQRLWFYNKTKHYSNQLKFSSACVGCGQCATDCPMQNIVMTDGHPMGTGNCTMCYRCINHCPKQAITLLGDKVVKQLSY